MSQQPTTQKLTDKDELQEGDRVIVDKNKKGQIRVVITDDKVLGMGTYYGIRLTEPRGVTNGTYKDKKFFWCPDNHGVIVQRKRIKQRYLGTDYDFSKEEEPKTENPTLERLRKKRAELKRLKAKFRSMDKDGSLTIDVEEFGNIVSGKDGLYPSMKKKEVQKLFNEIDVTKSGSISYAEFDGWVKKLGGIHVMEHKDFLQIREKFKKMDKDGDAKITLDEFLDTTCIVFPKLTKNEAAHLFSEIDTSGDGTVTFDEFDTWVKNQEEN